GRLADLVSGGKLSPVERARAGDALGRLGDPRFRADAWHLPDEPLLGFVEVRAGPFRMGSDKRKDSLAFDDETPQHKVSLPTFYIARFPTTVAQFRAFAEDSGFKLGDADCLRGIANHPVVLVSWHEASKYCEWLTAKLRGWDRTPEPLRSLLRSGKDGGTPWTVTLPSDEEWEKTARGTDGRVYPWGNDPDPNRANYDDTRIGTTSGVGCFPGGRSPYEVEEMSGNVWEWTRSAMGKDRVLRGGSFWDLLQLVRCADRLRLHPHNWSGGSGFRVVLSPFNSGL
ncbi:MAG: formylglycine-generating enzyme family protein, partial [Gemmatimonadales bacterium]